MKSIVIQGARQNNLKGVSLEIPRDRLVVITGLSGSGKSSLAFDTIYAEGQRRYVESLSVYARQFLDQMAKPDVDSIEGLSPAISIEQRSLSKNPRSTVGTITEIYDHLRLLFARVGSVHCPDCGEAITAMGAEQMVDRVLQLPEKTRLLVMAPVARRQKGDHAALLEDLRREGFTRVAVDGQDLELSGEVVELDPRQKHDVDVVVDRLIIKPGLRSRLSDSVELALKRAQGVVKVRVLGGDELVFSERPACVECGVGLAELEPRTFSFNNPHGACPRCSGLGLLLEFDEARLVPHPERSLKQGAIEPWEKRNQAYYRQVLESLSLHFGFDLFEPYEKLPVGVRELLMRGSGDEEVEFFYKKGKKKQTFRQPFEGVIPELQRRLARKRKDKAPQEADGVADELHRYMQERTCPDCGGARLRREALHVRLDGRNIHEVSSMTISQALATLGALALEGRDVEVGQRLLREIVGRLTFLEDVGLGYLSLHRTSGSLSGGEGQRVRLATQIGAALMGVIYILDEPSIGLHKRDHQRLLETLLRLRDMGNTVLVVEHDEETIRAADHIVDMGPGAGARGGEVVVAGTPAEIEACEQSLTGRYLSGAEGIAVPAKRRASRHHLEIRGASQNNLQDLDVRIPLNVLTCVTGVSGSGKSTLIMDTLLQALRRRLHNALDPPGAHRKLNGVHLLEKVIAIDQSPIGRTPRSNPATYSGVFNHVRELFAGQPESKVRGYKSGRYSFNVKGGRCEACKGDGILRIAMHFLPDVFVQCEVCRGRRYNRETLQVKYRGRSIADVLAMTVDEASELFAAIPKLDTRLQTLREVGLGYLTLGQPANTLSGGEAQRLKLSTQLSRRSSAGTLYILDEPTTGLHLADIHVLMDALDRLVEGGSSVIIIEHHLDVIKCADQIIDMGPEGGDGGGTIVAAGTPEDVAQTPGSFTGAYLREVL